MLEASKLLKVQYTRVEELEGQVKDMKKRMSKYDRLHRVSYKGLSLVSCRLPSFFSSFRWANALARRRMLEVMWLVLPRRNCEKTHGKPTENLRKSPL